MLKLSDIPLGADDSVLPMNLVRFLININFLSSITSSLYKSHMDCQPFCS